MPKADEPNDQAPQSLDARIAAFEARKAAEQPIARRAREIVHRTAIVFWRI
jgi:F0F1-type ATP synthase assembly protein I